MRTPGSPIADTIESREGFRDSLPTREIPKPDRLCPNCDANSWNYQFICCSVPVYRCTTCGLICLHPQPTRSDILKFYKESTGQNPFDEHVLAESLTEQEASFSYLRKLSQGKTSRSGMLLVAPLGHPFANIARSQGYEVETYLESQELNEAKLPKAHYESAVIIFQLEQATSPIKVLGQIHSALKSEGQLFLVTPTLDSWSGRFFRTHWTEWRPENLFYFDTQTIQAILLKSGFAKIRTARDQRRYSLQHLYDRARAFPRTLLTRTVQTAYNLVPVSLRRGIRLKLVSSGMIVTAQRVEIRQSPLLSIVMPVYNERTSFARTMDAVLGKQIEGVDKEIIVVESNSTDGTREIAQSYQGHPGVKVILEDRPKGKGSAVRIGFKHAQGDYVLIQDADEEYDVNDYDSLIEPIKTYKRAFVLGSRHTGDWKIRRFNQQPGTTIFFNAGHLLFVTLLNLLYNQRLKDPFTMYKVFRRDCLHGLRFECDRFDFDFELVIKLVRKGYVPLEIPVNYQARSFKEGKKISAVRDPLTWARALVKFRFSPLYDENSEL